MKKLLFLTLSILFAFSIQAQSITNKFIGYWYAGHTLIPGHTYNDLSTVPAKINIVILAFGNFNFTDNGEIDAFWPKTDTSKERPLAYNELKNAINKLHKQGQKVMIAMGGAGYPMSNYIKSPQDIKRFTLNLINALKRYNLDGVDLDIEDYYRQTNQVMPPAQLQIDLIQSINNAFHQYFPKQRKYLSYTVLLNTDKLSSDPITFVNTGIYNEVLQKAHKYLSFLNFMTYDVYLTPTQIKQDLLSYTQSPFFIKKEKLVLGIMEGPDDHQQITTLLNAYDYVQFVQSNALFGLMMWDLNRDINNITKVNTHQYTNCIGDSFKDFDKYMPKSCIPTLAGF